MVSRSAASYEPYHLVQFLFTICSEFNRWYTEEPILGREDTGSRAAIVSAVITTIGTGLKLLGIEPVERI